jgi:hypothetical protein
VARRRRRTTPGLHLRALRPCAVLRRSHLLAGRAVGLPRGTNLFALRLRFPSGGHLHALRLRLPSGGHLHAIRAVGRAPGAHLYPIRFFRRASRTDVFAIGLFRLTARTQLLAIGFRIAAGTELLAVRLLGFAAGAFLFALGVEPLALGVEPLVVLAFIVVAFVLLVIGRLLLLVLLRLVGRVEFAFVILFGRRRKLERPGALSRTSRAKRRAQTPRRLPGADGAGFTARRARAPAQLCSIRTRRSFRGNCSVTTVPTPSLLSRPTCPPWSRMMRCAIISPRPWPPDFVVWYG